MKPFRALAIFLLGMAAQPYVAGAVRHALTAPHGPTSMLDGVLPASPARPAAPVRAATRLRSASHDAGSTSPASDDDAIDGTSVLDALAPATRLLTLPDGGAQPGTFDVAGTFDVPTMLGQFVAAAPGRGAVDDETGRLYRNLYALSLAEIQAMTRVIPSALVAIGVLDPPPGGAAPPFWDRPKPVDPSSRKVVVTARRGVCVMHDGTMHC